MHILGDLVSWLPLGLPAFVFVITVVVFFHELGHFLVARSCGIGVEAFSIGFGPEIVGWTDRHGTRWKISFIPLGGYVKFLGDAGPASTPDRELIARMSPAERALLFQAKPLWQRAAVVAAGPAANFLLAIVIFAATFMFVGREVIRPVVGAVEAHSAAAAAGLKPGDVITRVDGEPVHTFSDLQAVISISPGRTMSMQIDRDHRVVRLQITPRLTQVTDRFGNVQQIGLIGVRPRITRADIEILHYGPVGALRESVRQCWFVVDSTMTYLWRMVLGHENATQLTGPVGIAQVSEQVAAIGFLALVNLAALISVSIGLLNLFPIPILDGGHLLYYGVEAVLGRPLGARAQDVGFRVGLAVMLGLMVLATWNDLVRLNLF
ncbi:MAG: RIP metalloprotease RseP [Alphaproteobacteria bacterium]|nr:RIP metalloprotease RseP [Alphaproteobacteria bacterium]